jgi:hypothetical protein
MLGAVMKFDCDRCGKEFAEAKRLEKPDKDDLSISRGSTVMLPVVRDGSVSFVQTDLCGSCTESLSKWREKRKKSIWRW